LPQRADAACIQITPRFATTNTPVFYGAATTPNTTSFTVEAKDNTGTRITNTADLMTAGDVMFSGYYLTDE